MTLHTSGVKVAPRGSLQDLILTRFMSEQLSAKMYETRFMQLAAFKEGQEDWNRELNKMFKDYVSVSTGGAETEDKREEQLKDYLVNRVLKTNLFAKNEEGTMVVEGTEALL